MGFLILHGWQGNAPGHWQTWLAERLQSSGEAVAYPDLPDPDWPTLAAWLDAVGAEVRRAGPDVVVCHSLACIAWLHHVARTPQDGDRRTLLVAPPADIPELPPGFFPLPDEIAVPGAELWGSDDDPYCPGGAQVLYGRAYGIPSRHFEGGGHLNTDAGYGPWPEAEAWCRSAASGAKNGVET
jgi:predicted alpha/beta hydrolase family esterase